MRIAKWFVCIQIIDLNHPIQSKLESPHMQKKNQTV